MKYFNLLFFSLTLTLNAFAAGTSDNDFSIGTGASNKRFIFKRASGSTNPNIRWNETTDKVEVSHDGVVYSEVRGIEAPAAISASDIDWSLGNVFTKTLAANTTFTFSNQTSGKTIVVRVTNTASNYTVTWPVGVKWSGGTAPTQTIGAKSDVYTFIYDGTDTFGSVVQDF